MVGGGLREQATEVGVSSKYIVKGSFDLMDGTTLIAHQA